MSVRLVVLASLVLGIVASARAQPYPSFPVPALECWDDVRLFPSLSSVSDGQTFKLAKTIKLFVPAKAKLRVYGQGWECDVAGEPFPCPTGRNEVALFNDPIGDKIAELSLSKAPGKHTLMSTSGDWKLTYEVSKLKS